MTNNDMSYEYAALSMEQKTIIALKDESDSLRMDIARLKSYNSRLLVHNTQLKLDCEVDRAAVIFSQQSTERHVDKARIEIKQVEDDRDDWMKICAEQALRAERSEAEVERLTQVIVLDAKAMEELRCENIKLKTLNTKTHVSLKQAEEVAA